MFNKKTILLITCLFSLLTLGTQVIIDFGVVCVLEEEGGVIAITELGCLRFGDHPIYNFTCSCSNYII